MHQETYPPRADHTGDADRYSLIGYNQSGDKIWYALGGSKPHDQGPFAAGLAEAARRVENEDEARALRNIELEDSMRADDGHYVELSEVHCVADTPKALLIGWRGIEFWVPRSVVIEEGSTVEERGDVGDIVIKHWFAKKLAEEHDCDDILSGELTK